VRLRNRGRRHRVLDDCLEFQAVGGIHRSLRSLENESCDGKTNDESPPLFLIPIAPSGGVSIEIPRRKQFSCEARERVWVGHCRCTSGLPQRYLFSVAKCSERLSGTSVSARNALISSCIAFTTASATGVSAGIPA